MLELENRNLIQLSSMFLNRYIGEDISIMGQRIDFGTNWSDIVTKYFFGKKPPISESLGWEALGIVERLSPEYIDRVLDMNSLAPSIIAPVIDRGIILAACEKLGFNDLIEKIKQEDVAAYSEAIFAAALEKLEYTPEYEPLNGIGRRPDFRIYLEAEAKEVYIEIISPNLSDKMKNAYDKMKKTVNETIERYPGYSAKIQLVNQKTEISNTHQSPLLGVAKLKWEGNILTQANISLPLTDDRAQKLMETEAKHFSPNEINLLVIDVSSIPNGIKGWAPLIQRRLQPKLNRRFGAVVLFQLPHQGVIHRCWSVIPHPNPYFSVPENFLNDIMSLNNSICD